MVIVEIVIGVNKCANDGEGVEGVTGEAVTKADLGVTGTECICPTGACGCIEFNHDLAFKSGILGQLVQNVLQVGSSVSLLCSVLRRTVNKGDSLSIVVAVEFLISVKDFNSSLQLLFCKSGVVTGKGHSSLFKGETGHACAGPCAIISLFKAVSDEEAFLSLGSEAVNTTILEGSRVFDIVVVLGVNQAKARNCGTGPDLFNDVVSVQGQVESVSEFSDCKNTVVVAAGLQNAEVREQLHTERTGGRCVGNVLGGVVVCNVVGVEGCVIIDTCKEAHPLIVGFSNLEAVDSGYVVLVLVLVHVPTIPVLVLNELVVRTCLKLNELVGTPACGGIEIGVVGGGPEFGITGRSYLVSLVLNLVYERKACHVVRSLPRESAVLFEESVGLVKANYDCVFGIDGVDTNFFPLNVTNGVLSVDGNPAIASAGLAVFCIICAGLNILPCSCCIEQPVSAAGGPTIGSVEFSCIVVSKVLRHSIAVLVNKTCGHDAPTEELVIESQEVKIKGFACIKSCLVACITFACNRVVSTFLVLEEVLTGHLDSESVVVGVTTEVHECRIQLRLHGVNEVSSGNSCAIVPLQVVAQGDLPSVAALSDLLSGVAPLSVNGSGNVFELGSCGVVGGVRANNNAINVDGTVVIELLIIFELVVIVEEGRTDVAHNLSIVVISIGQFVPVGRHYGCGGVVLSLFVVIVRNSYAILRFGLLRSSRFGSLGSARNYHNCCQNQTQYQCEYGADSLFHSVFSL